VHQQINQVLDLKPVGQMPLSYQKAGNCSWANVEATVPVSYVLLQLVKLKNFNPANFEESVKNGMRLHSEWLSWDKDRALEECIQSFYESDTLRKASKAAILGAVLFQGCRYSRNDDIKRAEKILKILMLKDYRYILKSYIRVFCDTRLTVLGKNLLKILDDFGIDRDGL
jgi:hypothetical protein